MIGRFLLGVIWGGVLGAAVLVLIEVWAPVASPRFEAAESSGQAEVQLSSSPAELAPVQSGETAVAAAPKAEEVPEAQAEGQPGHQPEAIASAVPGTVSSAPDPAEETQPGEALAGATEEPAAIAPEGLPPLSAEEEARLAEMAAEASSEGEGAAEPPVAGAEGASADPAADSASAAESGPGLSGAEVVAMPLKAHARPFQNAELKPVFAIVLIDTGEAEVDRAALAALPFPVSFALDPTAPEAAEHAAIYRRAGQEVIALASPAAMAPGAKAALAEFARTLPESVVVMEAREPTFQSDRALSGEVVATLGAQGRGLLTWGEGMNAADQIARREDVPTAVIFRSVDERGEDVANVRRALDRAAFKASQEGRVTVVGHTRPETVKALLEWSVEGRSASVALAPVTAVLSID